MSKMLRTNKIAGLALFAGIYIIAYLLGFLAGRVTDILILKMFVFDLTSTVLIWAVSLAIHNSSLYDPYWSLTPAVMVIYVAAQNFCNLGVYHYILLAVFLLWSMRLTLNWVTTFENLLWEDWRYRKYRELPKPLWHLANFFGIMMIPTLLVFAGTVPMFILMIHPAGPLSLLGATVIISGTVLEFISDRQMHSFLRKMYEKKTCREGLWRYSRHPNYLGEILIWVGVYLALLLPNSEYWYLFGGVAAMIFLFNVISIPLAEKRQLLKRPEYAAYRNETSALLILPTKKLKQQV